MASPVICPGYVGIALVDDEFIRCSDFSVNSSQETSFYDHVIGLNDTVPADQSTKGEAIGFIQTQKKIWRPSPISISGGLGFPATEHNLPIFFNHAKYGTYFDVHFTYHRGSPSKARLFRNCRVNSFSFTAMSSEIVNISVDIMALNLENVSITTAYETPEKLITWDKIEITSESIPTTIPIQAFDFTINNNLQYVYTADPSGTNKFLPRDLRVGMQEVTGNISFYLEHGTDFLNALTEETNIDFVCPGLETPIYTVFKPRQLPGAIGPVIRSIPWIGVDKAFGT